MPRTPASPISSPNAASGKSVWTAGTGSLPAISGSPAPSPTPKIPPRANAWSAWTIWNPEPSGSAKGSSQTETRSRTWGKAR